MEMLASCRCATDTTSWYDCQRHPWDGEKKPKRGIALTFCEGEGHVATTNDIDSNMGVVEVDIRIAATLSNKLKSRSLENFKIQDRRAVSVSQQSTVAILSDANQLLQRQMLCADSIISNLRVDSPPPVSWRIRSL